MFLFADILGAWWEHSVAWGGMSAEVWSGKLAEKAERWSELATPEELHNTAKGGTQGECIPVFQRGYYLSLGE